MRSNNILSLFVGQQSQHLAYHFYHLQAQQLFDEEQDAPKLDHKVIWKDLEKHVPRCLVYDLKGNIKLLEHQNRTNNKKIIAKLEGQPIGLSLAGDLQEQINYRLKGMHKKEQEPEEEDEWKEVFDNFQIEQRCLIESGRHSSKKEWEMFYGGKNITKRQDEMQKLVEPIRKQLEMEDYMEGFMMFGEISNGFGSITQTLITELHNHCPKAPLFLSGITSPSKKQSQAEIVNTLIAYSSFLPVCDIFLPLNIKSQDYPYFEGANHLEYRSISPLISNLYYPFTTGNSFGEYIKNITQYRHNNLFNACYTVPLIQQQSLDKFYSVLRYLHPTSNKLNYLRPLSNHTFKPSLRSFSETYVLKGGFNLQSHQVPQLSYIDFKMTDIIFSQKDNIQYSEPYHQMYGKEANSFPFHSIVFSHECLKGEILDVANSLKGIDNVVLERYFSEGVEKDDLKEMSNQMKGFYDNYDSKGEESEGDD